MTEATFTAEKLDDALGMVKRALGADALIVSSRRVGSSAASGDLFEVCARTAQAAPSAAPTPRATIVERVLAQNEVPAAIASELVSRSGNGARSLREARESIERALRASVGFIGPTHAKRTIALVGPTGVGKTTTIAKLAARDALIERLRVLLVSTDDYRVGGAEQLERYAELIGVPFEIATDAATLAQAIARHPGIERVYVDTAGRAPRDAAAIEKLARMLGGLGEPVAIHLCLAASTRAGELTRALAQHAPLGACALAMTKLDETATFGGVLAACNHARLPLSWFTTGQRVPEDLELASAARLAAVLCGDEVTS